MKEEWRDVEGYEGLYEVSSLSRIRSLNRTYITSDGRRVNHVGRILSPIIDTRGYTAVYLYKDKTPKKFRFHRIVAIAFISNPYNKPHINHINGITGDNRIVNLEWCTPSENERHSYDVLGKKAIGSAKGKFGYEHNRSKAVAMLTIEGCFIKEFGSMHEASREIGISPSLICVCCKDENRTGGGNRWSYV